MRLSDWLITVVTPFTTSVPKTALVTWYDSLPWDVCRYDYNDDDNHDDDDDDDDDDNDNSDNQW